MKKLPTLMALFVLMLLAWIPAQGLYASLPVIDAANLKQSVVRVAKAIQQINNQIRQLEVMRAQLRSMETNLQKVDDPQWRELDAYMLELNELVQSGKSLGYETPGILGAFREVNPGFVAMKPELYALQYAERIDIVLDTFGATLASAGHQALEYYDTEETLGDIRELADAAEGNLEALEVSNMLQGHTAQEITKLNQVLAASLNAQAVYYGIQMSLEAGHEATLREALERSKRPFFTYGSGGLSPIPVGWQGV